MTGCCGPMPENHDRHGAEREGPDRDSADPQRYRSIFGPRFSQSVTQRYEKKGLGRVEQRIVDFLGDAGIEGASVLEIGGGAGEIQLELLARGAARTENLELSDAYEDDAAHLIRRAGMTSRVSRRLGVDLAQAPDAVEPADVVVLHRVVCCYPDYAALLGAAADHARRAIVFSYPPRNLATRAFTRTGNMLLHLMGRSFQIFVHPPEAMLNVVRAHGLTPVYEYNGLSWDIAGAVRSV